MPLTKDQERERHKRRYSEDPEYARRAHFKKSYGITIEDYDIMSESQGHVCAICGNAETAKNQYGIKRLAVDHCHQSGTVRGLLCADCNRALGMFRDNPNLLRKAADYLEEARFGYSPTGK